MAKKTAIWQDINDLERYAPRSGSTRAWWLSKAASSGTPFDAPLRKEKKQRRDLQITQSASRKASNVYSNGAHGTTDCNDHNLDDRNPEGSSKKLLSLNTNQQKQRGSASLLCCQDDTKENDPTEIIDNSNLKTTSAVAFTISVGDASSRKPPPKKLHHQAHGRKQAGTSTESIQEKLEVAAVRRKQQEEARLRRIHSRQEAARKLAHNVEILLEQRALAAGNMTMSRDHENRMSSRELLATAKQVACNFNSLTHQMKSDFAINDKCTRADVATNSSNLHAHCSGKNSCDQNQNISSETKAARASTQQSPAKGGIAFTIAFKESDNAVENSACHKLKSPVKLKARANLTVKDIEEKQRKAEERRNTRRKERVKRVVANREALFQFASNLDTFLSVQDSDNVSSRREAAKLASEIADTFDRMSQKCGNVLKEAEGFPCQTLFRYSGNTEEN